MVDSTSDDRTQNNVVRHEYRKLSDSEKQDMLKVKDLGAAFIALCNDVCGMSKTREMSIAITKAEEAVMWAVKHITK